MPIESLRARKAILTELSSRNPAPPATGQVIYWDKTLAGFGLRVSQGGTVVKNFFRWAKRNHCIESNPLADLPMPAAKRSRDRVLSPQEFAKVYGKVLAYPHPFGPIVPLLLLTGQRRGKIGAL